MIKKFVYSFVVIVSSIVILIFLYWYLNPSIDNIDFDIEYRISNGEKKYYELRNKKYSEKEYLFNHQSYYNNMERKKLIIHSLDKHHIKGEKVLFVIEDFMEEYPIGIIDYYNYKGDNNFNIFHIKYLEDSIYIRYKNDDTLFFKGSR